MKERRQRTCESCGKPLGGTLAECYECNGESYRAGGRRVPNDDDSWHPTYNGLLWKIDLGVDPTLLEDVYDI